jgi:ankyrin repeat protein
MNKVVKLLIEKGCDVNARNGQPLIQAVHTNNMELVKLLLSHDANIHADQDSALLYAIHDANLPMVQYLVNNGADINAPLIMDMATNIGRPDIKQYLDKKLKSGRHKRRVPKQFI